MSSAVPEVQASPKLERALKLKDLVLFGVVLITPIVPMPIFGISMVRGGGHVVTASLIALTAMLFTAISYGRMARAYPSAGSAFTYVGREIHPGFGFLVGWSLILDYVIAPVCAAVWCAQVSVALVAQVPAVVWQIFYSGLFTLLNVRAIRSTARGNLLLTAGMIAVIAILFVAGIHYIAEHPSTDPIYFTRPFYDPETFTLSGLLGCTTLATLNYVGFDAISTLAEEAENPRRNILRATVLTCLIVGVLASSEAYLAQLVWPASEPFPNLDTAYVWVARRIWEPLFALLGVTLLLANANSGMASHLGASRLLYGMGRSQALPERFFGAVDRKNHIPRNNVLLIGAVVLVASLFLSYGFLIELVNFGALTAYLGVNAAAFMRYFVRGDKKTVLSFVLPVIGFLVCLLLLWGLSVTAKLVGFAWSALGFTYVLWRTRWFRRPLWVVEPTMDGA